MPDKIDFLDEYFALFARFYSHMFQRSFSFCAVMNAANEIKADFQGAIRPNNAIWKQILEWPEWVALDNKVKENGGESLKPYFVICYHFTEITNALALFQTSHTLNASSQLPVFRDIARHPDILTRTLLDGTSSLSERMDDHFIILIQGLKIETPIELAGIGTFAPIDEATQNYRQFWSSPHTKNHLYTAFYTKSETFTEDGFIKRFMTSLRLIKEGDIRLLDILVGHKHFMLPMSYQKAKHTTGDTDYLEETAIFGARPPKLLEIDNTEVDTFCDHMLTCLQGLTKMEAACEYFNHALIGPKSLQIPMLFFALEACFPDKTGEKSEKLATYIVHCLDEHNDLKKVILLHYSLRSSIVHGDEKELTRNQRKLASECRNVSLKDGAKPEMILLTRRIFTFLASQKWHPKKGARKLRAQFSPAS
ncbi:hypothetical protein [Pseudovibrio sp. Alg231-02]|uniref:hypothetical protein n=1 Tax=Pseudovibrio sp. Alg231-02 TaxID=1922223 RepID=UPI000D55DC6A|nr:hypothetical protein [Pseudovibrio sp. Alg231-02]